MHYLGWVIGVNFCNFFYSRRPCFRATPVTNRQRRLPEATKADLVARVPTLEFCVRLCSQPVFESSVQYLPVCPVFAPVRAIIALSLFAHRALVHRSFHNTVTV